MTTYTYTPTSSLTLEASAAFYGVTRDDGVDVAWDSITLALFADGTTKLESFNPLNLTVSTLPPKGYSSRVPRHGESVASNKYYPPVLLYIDELQSSNLIPITSLTKPDNGMLYVSGDGTVSDKWITVAVKQYGDDNSTWDVAFRNIANVVADATKSSTSIEGTTYSINRTSTITVENFSSQQFNIYYSDSDMAFNGASTNALNHSIIILCNGTVTMKGNEFGTGAYIIVIAKEIKHGSAFAFNVGLNKTTICASNYSGNMATTFTSEVLVNNKYYYVKDSTTLTKIGTFSNQPIRPGSDLLKKYTGGVLIGSTLWFTIGDDPTIYYPGDNNFTPPANTTWIEFKQLNIATGTENRSKLHLESLCVIMKLLYGANSCTMYTTTKDDPYCNRVIVSTFGTGTNAVTCNTYLVIGSDSNWLIDTAPYVYEKYIGGMLETYRISDKVFYPVSGSGSRYMTLGVPLSGVIHNDNTVELLTMIQYSTSSPYTGRDPSGSKAHTIKVNPGATNPETFDVTADCKYTIERGSIGDVTDTNAAKAGMDLFTVIGGNRALSKYRLKQTYNAVDDASNPVDVYLRAPYMTHIPYRPMGAKITSVVGTNDNVTLDKDVIVVTTQDPRRSNVVDFEVNVEYPDAKTYHPGMNVAKFFAMPQDTPYPVYADNTLCTVLIVSGDKSAYKDIMLNKYVTFNGTEPTAYDAEPASGTYYKYDESSAGGKPIYSLRKYVKTYNGSVAMIDQTTISSYTYTSVTEKLRIRVTFGDMISHKISTATTIAAPVVDKPYYQRKLDGILHHNLPPLDNGKYIIDHNAKKLNFPFLEANEIAALKEQGYMTTDDKNFERIKYVDDCRLFSHMTIYGVSELSAPNGARKFYTPLLPNVKGKKYPITSPAVEVTVGADGYVLATELPFILNNVIYIKDETPNKYADTVVVRYDQLSILTVNLLPAQHTFLLNAGFILEGNLLKRSAVPTYPLIGPNIIVEGKHILTSAAMVKCPFDTTFSYAIVNDNTVKSSDAAGNVSKDDFPIRVMNVVYTLSDNGHAVKPVEVIGYADNSVDISNYALNMVEILRANGFTVTGSLATREFNKTDAVITPQLIIQGLRYYKLQRAGDSQVTIDLPVGTKVGTYTVTQQGTLDKAAFPFVHNNVGHLLSTATTIVNMSISEKNLVESDRDLLGKHGFTLTEYEKLEFKLSSPSITNGNLVITGAYISMIAQAGYNPETNFLAIHNGTTTIDNVTVTGTGELRVRLNGKDYYIYCTNDNKLKLLVTSAVGSISRRIFVDSNDSTKYTRLGSKNGPFIRSLESLNGANNKEYIATTDNMYSRTTIANTEPIMGRNIIIKAQRAIPTYGTVSLVKMPYTMLVDSTGIVTKADNAFPTSGFPYTTLDGTIEYIKQTENPLLIGYTDKDISANKLDNETITALKSIGFSENAGLYSIGRRTENPLIITPSATILGRVYLRAVGDAVATPFALNHSVTTSGVRYKVDANGNINIKALPFVDGNIYYFTELRSTAIFNPGTSKLNPLEEMTTSFTTFVSDKKVFYAFPETGITYSMDLTGKRTLTVPDESKILIGLEYTCKSIDGVWYKCTKSS